MTYDLISVDDHIIEPPNVWWDRLPSRFRQAGPHVIEAEGREYWLFEGQRGPTMGLNAVAGKPHQEFATDPVRYADMIPGCYDPVARAKDLLSDGIRGSLCFPTFPRFAGVKFLEANDRELADLCVKAYNDFVLEEWAPSVPGLYIPMVIGPLWDPEAMAAEVLRCAARGARAVSFPENTARLGLPSLHDEHWDPVWEAVTETELVVCMHIGSSGSSVAPSEDASYATVIALAPMSAQSAGTDLMFSPVPRRFPTVKFALSEGGIGWVPFALERADHTWEKHRYWAELGDAPPSEIFRRNIWVCFIDERRGLEAREWIGVGNIMWECDYPHADTPWPTSQATLASVLEAVPEAEVAAMTHRNAERLFRWEERPNAAQILGEGHAAVGPSSPQS